MHFKEETVYHSLSFLVNKIHYDREDLDGSKRLAQWQGKETESSFETKGPNWEWNGDFKFQNNSLVTYFHQQAFST